jgi:hypothetical protein
VFHFKNVPMTGQTEGQSKDWTKTKILVPEPLDNFLSFAQVVQNIKITFCPLNIVQEKIYSKL